jgi:hypothetical protein
VNREDIGMGNTINRRAIVLSALLMALVISLSSVGLDDAEAKKGKQLNLVRCPAGGSSTDECVGTNAGDRLVGRDGTYDNIKGGDGNDAYDGKGGCDALDDASSTSNDKYVISVKELCNVGISSLSIQDNGGSKDILDLSRFYKSTDFEFSEAYIHLNMDGPGVNDVSIYNFFTTDSVDYFRFSDKTLTAQQVEEMSVDE